MSYHVTERLLNISGQPFHLLRNHLLCVEHLVASCGWQISFCRLERHLCLFLSLSLLNCLMHFSRCTRLQVWWCLVNIPLTLPCCALLSIHPSIHPSILTSIHSYVHTYMHTYIHTYIHSVYILGMLTAPDCSPLCSYLSRCSWKMRCWALYLTCINCWSLATSKSFG